MLLNPAGLEAAYLGFNNRFQAGFAKSTPFWSQLAMENPSDTDSEVYHFLTRIPGLREWTGERVFNNLSAAKYSLQNKDYEASFEIDRNDFEDNKLRQYDPAFQMLGDAVARWPDDLVLSVLLNGGSSTCYDGQYFFDTDHPKKLWDSTAGTQANLFTTTALSAANFSTVRASMQTFVGEDGIPLGIMPNLLVVPPALEKTALEIVVAQTVPNSAGTASLTNVQAGQADVLVLPRLSAAAGGSDTTWYLFDSSKPVKPFVFQLRRQPTLQMYFNPSDPEVFKKRKFQWGVDGRGAAGYGLWFLGAKCTA